MHIGVMEQFHNTTPICIQIHYVFHYILNEIGQLYHNESGQPFSKQGPVATDK